MPKGTPYYTSDPCVEIDYPSADSLQDEFTAWDNLSDEALTELESAIKRVRAPLHCRLIWWILDGVGIVRRFIRDGVSCYKGHVASRQEIDRLAAYLLENWPYAIEGSAVDTAIKLLEESRMAAQVQKDIA